MERDLTWDDFKEATGTHRWVYDDKELESEYLIKKMDGAIEVEIRARLTSDPVREEVTAALKAVNAFRRTKRVADSKE